MSTPITIDTLGDTCPFLRLANLFFLDYSDVLALAHRAKCLEWPPGYDGAKAPRDHQLKALVRDVTRRYSGTLTRL